MDSTRLDSWPESGLSGAVWRSLRACSMRTEVVKRLYAKAKVAIETANDGWETASDSEDDCFV